MKDRKIGSEPQLQSDGRRRQGEFLWSDYPWFRLHVFKIVTTLDSDFEVVSENRKGGPLFTLPREDSSQIILGLSRDRGLRILVEERGRFLRWLFSLKDIQDPQYFDEEGAVVFSGIVVGEDESSQTSGVLGLIQINRDGSIFVSPSLNDAQPLRDAPTKPISAFPIREA